MAYNTTDLIRITSPFFVVGIDWNAFYVDNVRHYNHRCAPIIGYMRTWSIERILLYCAKRGWKWEVLPHLKETQDARS
uniref:Uncharacterized protein n=1 Tax=viral metagenome TaxID=1070528 RepID=A0A6M3KD84_9ZZZZ